LIYKPRGVREFGYQSLADSLNLESKSRGVGEF